MKKILGIILCVMTLYGYSQITPVRLVRVANDATVFAENITKGTMVYNVDDAVLRIAFKSIAKSNAIRDVEASFYIISTGQYWDKTLGHIYPSTITDSLGIGTDSPSELFEINGGKFSLNGTTDFYENTSGKSQIDGGSIVLNLDNVYVENDLSFASQSVFVDSILTTVINSDGALVTSSAVVDYVGTVSDTSLWGRSGGSVYTKTVTDSVGIGVKSPAAILDVAGRIEISSTGGSIFIGGDAGPVDDLTANENIYIGYEAGLLSVNANNNIGIGADALRGATDATDSQNTAIGSAALLACSANGNTAIGWQSMLSNITGGNNTAVGKSALNNNTSGNNTVAIGLNAGSTYTGGLSNTSPDQCVYIGDLSEANTANSDNEIVIGYDAIGSGDNTATIGNESVTSVIMADDSSAVVYAGGFVTTGDIRTTQYISPDKAIHLFHYYGDSTVSYSYSTEWDHLSNIGDSLWINDHSDGFTESNDTITITGAGHYDFIATNTLSCDYNETVSIRFYNKTQTSGMPVAGAITGEGTDDYGTIITVASFVCAAGDEILLQIKGDGSGTAQLKNGIIKITKVHN